MSNETFTAYRFEKRNADCAMTFIALSDNGFTPQWANEAPSKKDPSAERALLIQLPRTEAARFRAYQDDARKVVLQSDSVSETMGYYNLSSEEWESLTWEMQQHLKQSM